MLCQSLEVRVRGPGDGKKGEFEQADDDRNPFHSPVGAGGHDDEQGRGGDRQGETARQAIEFSDPRRSGEFCNQRADRCRRQACRRQPGPADTKPFADQFTVAAPGVDTQPHR
jgi:hypothetical protein